jgi:cation transport ATPase
MSAKSIGEEVRRRFPRLTMSLVMAIIFLMISIVVPQTMISDVMVPGLNLNAGFLIGTITWLFAAIFLIRALSDALILSDIVTDIIVKRLGIKEERSSRRAARDAIYIIAIILVATALYPVLGTIGDIGNTLTTVTTYVALAIILLLIYDIGRILYRMVEQRAESMADRLAKMAERSKNRE